MCLCIYMYVYESRNTRGSNKSACIQSHVSCFLFKKVSLDPSPETLLSVIYHWTCSLVCARVLVCVFYVIHQASLAWESTLSSASAHHMPRSGRRASINRLLILGSLSHLITEKLGILQAVHADISTAQTGIRRSPGLFKAGIKLWHISVKVARSNRRGELGMNRVSAMTICCSIQCSVSQW